MYTSLTRPKYKRGPRIPHLLGFKNYLNNYYAMYKRLMRSRVRADLTSPTYLGLRII